MLQISGSSMLALIIMSILGLGSLVGWMLVFYQYGVTNWLLYWLPSVNIVGSVIAVYVDRDSKSIFQQVVELENSKYNLKDV